MCIQYKQNFRYLLIKCFLLYNTLYQIYFTRVYFLLMTPLPMQSAATAALRDLKVALFDRGGKGAFLI